MEDGALLPSWVHKNLATLRQLEWRAASFGQELRVAAYRLFADTCVDGGAAGTGKESKLPTANPSVGLFVQTSDADLAGESLLHTPRSTSCASDEAVLESPVKRRRGASARQSGTSPGAPSNAKRHHASAPADCVAEGSVVEPRAESCSSTIVESLLGATRFLLQRRRALLAQKLGLLHESSCSLSSERFRLIPGRLSSHMTSSGCPLSLAGSGSAQPVASEFKTDPPIAPATRARNNNGSASLSGGGAALRTRRHNSGSNGNGSSSHSQGTASLGQQHPAAMGSGVVRQHSTTGSCSSSIELDCQSIKSNGSVASESTTATSSGSRNSGAARRSSRRIGATAPLQRQAGAGVNARARGSLLVNPPGSARARCNGTPTNAPSPRKKEQLSDWKLKSSHSTGSSTDRSSSQSSVAGESSTATAAAASSGDAASSSPLQSSDGGASGPVPGRSASVASPSRLTAVCAAAGAARGERNVEEVAAVLLRQAPQSSEAAADGAVADTTARQLLGGGAPQLSHSTREVTEAHCPEEGDAVFGRSTPTVSLASTEPAAQNGAGSGTSTGDWSGFCPVCGKDEFAFEGAENMVACDSCNNWFHFVCVGYVAPLVAAPPQAPAATSGASSGPLSRRGTDPRRRGSTMATRAGTKNVSNGSKRPKRSSSSADYYGADENAADFHEYDDDHLDVIGDPGEYESTASGASMETNKSSSRSRNSKNSSVGRRSSAAALSGSCAAVVVIRDHDDDDDSWYCPQCLEQLSRLPPISPGAISSRIVT